MRNVAGYAVAGIGIVTVGAVIILANPDDAGAWLPILTVLLAGLPGLVAVFQNSGARQRLEQHDVKLETVRKEVNGAQREALTVAVREAERAGRMEILAKLPLAYPDAEELDSPDYERTPPHDAA